MGKTGCHVFINELKWKEVFMRIKQLVFHPFITKKNKEIGDRIFVKPISILENTQNF